jgi:hypothetical protein
MKMNKSERVEYLMYTIEDLRSNNCNKLADLMCDELQKELNA